MKRLLIGLLLFCSTYKNGNAQALDSNVFSRIVERENKPIIQAVDNSSKAIDNQIKLLKDSVVLVIKNGKITPLKTNETVADFITFLPIALFLFILISTLIKLKKDNVKLSDFLIDKDTQVAIKKEEANVATANARFVEAKANAIRTNPQAFANANLTLEALDPPTPANPQEDPNTDKKEQSTSRLVAFISGITSVALAACITSFYFYRSFLGDTDVSIGNLATVLYGLGLGVLPYGFNKIANALK
jgi:hypothetical protein